jgi:ribosomal protein L11 methylase PrmA
LYSILIHPGESIYEEAIAELWQLGTAGLIEEGCEIRAFFQTRDAAEKAARSFAGDLISLSEEEFTSQAPAGVAAEPILAGRFFVAPSLCDIATPPGRIRLTIDAGTAFGSGRHESTQLMLEALETHLQPGMSLIDVGCGSAILSTAARLLGAGPVVACDIDPNALPVAKTSGTALFAGSADAVASATADIVLANISARVVDALAPDLHRIAKPQGLIIVSGFIDGHVPSRFRADKVLHAGEWQCWVCRRDAVLAGEETQPLDHSLRWW